MIDRLKMIAFVLVLGGVLTTALVSVDAFTKPYIAANQKKRLQESVLRAAGIEFTKSDMRQIFSERITPVA